VAKSKPIVTTTELFEDFIRTKVLKIDDLTRLAVPVERPVLCDLYYKSAKATVGSRIAAYVNGKEVCNIVYNGESGLKTASVDLSPFLSVGENELRCLCIVSSPPLEHVSDEGLVWIRREGATLIRRAFSTGGTLEPFDLRWKLLIPA
jgi:hypothetical protein